MPRTAKPKHGVSANRLVEMRRKNGWSQEEAAAKLGCHWITVSKLERGTVKLTHWLERFAAIYDVRPYELIWSDDDKRDLDCRAGYVMAMSVDGFDLTVGEAALLDYLVQAVMGGKLLSNTMEWLRMKGPNGPWKIQPQTEETIN